MASNMQATAYKHREEIERQAFSIVKGAGVTGPPVDPVAIAKSRSIRVYEAIFANDSVSGILRKCGDEFTILVNQNHPITRQRYTIAHELGHYFLHAPDADVIDTDLNLFRGGPDSEDHPSKRRQEIQANMFAAALLMPAEFVKDEFSNTRNVAELAKVFAVSQEAMGIRLAALDLG